MAILGGIGALASGAVSYSIQALLASGVVTTWGSLVTMNSAVATNVTMPRATAADVGKTVTIKNIGTGTVTVLPNATLPDVISGSVTIAPGNALTYEVTAAGVVHAIADLGGVAAPTADAIQTLTATGVITAWGSLVLADSATPINATLPQATAGDVGKKITIRGVGVGTVTVVPNATLPDVVNGSTSVTTGNAITYEVSATGAIQAVSDLGGTSASGVDTVQALTATGAVTAWGSIVTMDSATPATATLPQALAGDVGKKIIVKSLGVGDTTVAPNATLPDVISGLATLTQNQAVIYEVTAVGVVHAVADIVGTSGAPTTVMNHATGRRSTSQAITTAASEGSPQAILFDQLTAISGAPSLNSTTGEITLPAGTYRVEGGPGNAGQGRMFFRWFVNNVVAGSVGGVFAPSDTAGQVLPVGPAVHEFTVASPAVVKLAVIGTSNNTTIGFQSDSPTAAPWFSIQQLPTASVVPAGTVAVTPLTFGEVVIPSQTFAGGTTPADVTGSSFTLPGPGDYEVEYSVTGFTGTANLIGSVFIADSGNAEVPNSRTGFQANQSGGQQLSMSQVSRITTTGAATYKMRVMCHLAGSFVFINNSPAIGSGNMGVCKIVWKQLPTSTVVNPGTVPVTPLHRARLSHIANNIVGVALNTPVPLSVAGPNDVGITSNTTTGRMTIAQSGTYRVTASATDRAVASANTKFGIYVNGVLAAESCITNIGGTNDPGWMFFEGPLVFAAGDAVDMRPTVLDSTSDYGQTSLYVEQIPTSTVVNPGTVPVEALANGSAYLAANTNGTNAAQTLVSFTLPAAGTYEVDYFASMATSASASDNVLFLATSAAVLVPNTERVGDYSNAGSSRSTVSGTHTLTVAGATTFLLRGDANTTSTYRADTSGRTGVVWRQMPTATVIDPGTVPVNDQTASGYLDIGTRREQWGRHTTVGTGFNTITFPAPFLDANYRFVGTSNNNPGRIVTSLTTGRSNTAMNDVAQMDSAGNAVAGTFDWFAIGRKP